MTYSELQKRLKRESTIRSIFATIAIIFLLGGMFFFDSTSDYFETCMRQRIKATTYECVEWADEKVEEDLEAVTVLLYLLQED